MILKITTNQHIVTRLRLDGLGCNKRSTAFDVVAIVVVVVVVVLVTVVVIIIILIIITIISIQTHQVFFLI